MCEFKMTKQGGTNFIGITDYAFQNNRKKWMWWDFCAFSALFPAIQVTHLPKKIVTSFYFDGTSPPHNLLTPTKKKTTQKMFSVCFDTVVLIQLFAILIRLHSNFAILFSQSNLSKWKRRRCLKIRKWTDAQTDYTVSRKDVGCVTRWVPEGGWRRKQRRNNYTSTRLFVSSASSSERAAVTPSSCFVSNGTFELLPPDVTLILQMGLDDDQDFILFQIQLPFKDRD